MFHITLAYLKRWLTPEEAQMTQAFASDVFDRYLKGLRFQMGPVAFCRFETMQHFETLKVFEAPDG